MVDVLKFSYADVIARANRTSVEAAADQWIHEAMDEDTAADYDYVTVFEEGAPERRAGARATASGRPAATSERTGGFGGQSIARNADGCNIVHSNQTGERSSRQVRVCKEIQLRRWLPCAKWPAQLL